MFAGWTVDDGPRVWKKFDVWADIQAKLDDDNIAEAAATLRRYLEHVGFVLSDGLKAPVTFRADGNYTLNNLLPPGFSQAKKDMKAARAAAQSWGKSELEQEIGNAIDTLGELVAATQADNWMTNASVHYNEWANLEATEFAEVVQVFRSVIEFLQCGTCEALAHGTWCQRSNRTVGEGDISASYSADRIGSNEPVRKPFTHEGQKWVCADSDGRAAHCYILVHPSCFDGDSFTYVQRVRNGHDGRHDSKGFYHGMRVKHAGETMILCGPEIHFVEGVERQGDLFGF